MRCPCGTAGSMCTLYYNPNLPQAHPSAVEEIPSEGLHALGGIPARVQPHPQPLSVAERGIFRGEEPTVGESSGLRGSRSNRLFAGEMLQAPCQQQKAK